MRRLQWIFFGLYLIAVTVLAWFVVRELVLSGPHAAPRPDLVALPLGLPPMPQGYPTEKALLLAFLLGQVKAIDAFGDIPVPDTVTEQLDVEYGRVGDRALLLDLYTPKQLPGAVPGLIFIHGGGWESGKKSDYKYYTVRFAQRGYVVATMGYRLKREAAFPACIEDTKCAVRWMRENAASLGVDPNRIAVLGGSAGGHLSMMAGYSSDVPELEGTGGHAGVSSAVQAVVNLYGPTDLTVPFARTNKTVTSFLATTWEENPDAFAKVSPLHYLDAGDPPTLIIHGTIDSIVPVEQADMLAEQLKSLGVPYWYDRFEGWPHTLDIAKEPNERVQALICAFLERFLKGPTPAAPQ